LVPDGKRISFVARQPAVARHIISADGGTPEALPMGDSPTLAHSWSPDGNAMVFGEWLGTKAPVLRLLDFKTRQISIVPGSEGLIYPIWSPDGRYIAADADGGPRNGAWIYNVFTHEWKRLPLVECNYWASSHDSKYIYYDGPSGDQRAVMRLRVADGRIEKVATLTGIRRATGAFGAWFGLDPGDAPLLLRKYPETSRSMPSTGKLRRFGCDQGDCTQYPNILRQPEGICRDLSNEELFRPSLVLTSGVIYGEDH
jgi:Tol biopolymer transport system component